MSAADLYGPWEIAGYQVRIETGERVRLAAAREGRPLKALPAAVRDSEEMAWIRLLVDAAAQHRRALRALLENAMIEAIPLSGEDLAALALDPVGRGLLGGLLAAAGGAVGRIDPDQWALETLRGDFLRLAPPVVLVHPTHLQATGALEEWDRWLGRRWFRQPFKQVRRELYSPDADGRGATSSGRCAGETVRWDQARAVLEGRGWHRVTKSGGEREFPRSGWSARVEFRTPASRGFSREDVVLGRIYFLPRGAQSASRAAPGAPLESVPPPLFSETLRDVNLAAHAAGRRVPVEEGR